MGNQVVALAPSQIVAVERYLADHPEFKFDVNLGSTRFLKVARADTTEGFVVVKVFAIHDPSLPLLAHKEKLDEVRKKLSSAANCIPFQKVILTDKAGLLVREFVKYSLYDRISTRPFLTDIEKKWITFQILFALSQCHKHHVCHGDIKLENIMVTSWSWVLLVDFATFKPTFLPENNPADYSYFFDTSRRRTCYIAPERFVRASPQRSNEKINLLGGAPDSEELTPAMDIFSAGCTILELWNELDIPFTYSQLLQYRQKTYSPAVHLDKIQDRRLRDSIANMIDLEPKNRKSAEDYLEQLRDNFFPKYFYDFLQQYTFAFSATGNPIQFPDEKILTLKSEIDEIFKYLGPKRSVALKDSDEKCDTEKSYDEECEGLIIVTSLITSCIRGLHDCSSKLCSLEILLDLANHVSEAIILERILPYLMELAKDPSSRVKISAINTITECLQLVKKLPKSDANVFPEYILPGLAPLATDPKTAVRAAYAKNISKLAKISLRYLEQIQNDWYEQNVAKLKDAPAFNYELELQALHDMIQQTVSSLLTDTQTIVKQTLMHSGINELCIFFGKQKANDIILSHMITYLNDKEDKELRGSFFECIIGVATYLGWHCSHILKPLLQQGLTDCSEFVAVKSINAMSLLTELGLLRKRDLCELVCECSCFLVHPNLWIRIAVAGFVSTAAKTLPLVDVQCKIIPKLRPYMKYRLIQIDKPEIMLDSLINPIPRTVYDNVITYSDINLLLDVLKERTILRENVKLGKGLSGDYSREMDVSLKSLFRRLEANGMSEDMEDHILKMGPHLKKISKHKTSADARHNKQNEGKIELSTSRGALRSHVFNLNENQKNDFLSSNRRLHRTNTSGSIDTNVNSDWNYSTEVLNKQSEGTNSGGPPSRSTSSRPSSPPHEVTLPFISTDPSSNMSLHEKSYIHYRRFSCCFELSDLRRKQVEHYQEALRHKEWADQATWQPQMPPLGWKLKGVLVAHLHEHLSCVNKLCTLQDTSLFASCSSDGYVRLWDCAKMEGKNIANRSKQHFKMASGSSINGLSVCDNGNSLAAISADGNVSVLKIDPAGNKMLMTQNRKLDPDADGQALDVACLDSGSQNVVVYSTLFGNIVGWDLRSNETAFKMENELRQGVVTTFCIDPHQNWLATGSSNGYHSVWDLRFQLKINSIKHPLSLNNGIRIRKVICHPTEPSWIISSIQANNEIDMWNLETRFRQQVIWGAASPPLSTTKTDVSETGPEINASMHTTCMATGQVDNCPFLITGSSDQRIRYFDLSNTPASYLAVPAASDLIGTKLTYQYRLIDGSGVTNEESNCSLLKSELNSPRMKDKDDGLRPGPEPPAAGHRDVISDVVMCKSSQCFVASASMDGVIKVWK